MKISSIHLRNFKRFTDLKIENIPDTAKLVVLVGPNGCGKSSIFDGFLYWYRQKTKEYNFKDDKYFIKDNVEEFDSQNCVEINFHDSKIVNNSEFYVRTTFRNNPDYLRTINNASPKPTIKHTVLRMNQTDLSERKNHENYFSHLRAGIFDKNNDNKTVKELRDELFDGIQSSMSKLFGDFGLNRISSYLENPSFIFEKNSIQFSQVNLSRGEYAAFELLSDIYFRKHLFSDSIYCIDEVESHLHTKIQGDIIQEILRIIPPGSQLWITTHSIGVLRAAQLIEKEQLGSVAIIDLDDIDLDNPAVIEPSNLGKVTWDKLLLLSLGEISKQVCPKYIVICEGSQDGNKRKDFDSSIYNKIFGAEYPEILFISGGSSSEVTLGCDKIKSFVSAISPGTKVFTLIDRDDRSTEEINDLFRKEIIVLRKRNIESYIFASEVIELLATKERKESLIPQCLEILELGLENNVINGKPSDDYKSCSGDLFIKLKKCLDLTGKGNDKISFMKDTLAPLITKGTDTYRELKAIVIDKIYK